MREKEGKPAKKNGKEKKRERNLKPVQPVSKDETLKLHRTLILTLNFISV